MWRPSRLQVAVVGAIVVPTAVLTACHAASPHASATRAPTAASHAPPSSRPAQPPPAPAAFGPGAVSFVSANRGWALSHGPCSRCGILAATSDAGVHWRTVARHLVLPGRVPQLVEGRVGLFFADRHVGYVYSGSACGSCLLTTRDEGRTWSAVHLPPVDQLVSGDDTTAGGRSATLYALSTTGPRRSRGLYRKASGSRAWIRLALPTTSPDLVLAAQGDTVALMREGGWRSHGRLWVSGDQGLMWTRRPVPCRTPGSGASVLSLALGHPTAMLVDCFDNEGYMEAQWTQHHLFGSADGGRHWTRLGDPPQTGDPVLLADNGAGHAFLATESGGHDRLVTSTDGGLTWRPGITNDKGFLGWSGLRFVGTKTGFVLGPVDNAPEQLYRTLDGGRTWHRLRLPRPR